MKNLNYHYQELLKLLIVMSSEADIQQEAHGIGHAEEEMAIDLEIHYLENKGKLVSKEMVTLDEAKLIDQIDAIFESKSNDEGFWLELESHPGWVKVRSLANQVLTMMGKDHYTLNITVQTDTSWFSKNVSTQQITIDLVDNS